MAWRSFLLSLLGAILLLAQHDASDTKGKRNPAMGDPQAIAAGKKLFLTSCAGCHGPEGQGGRGPNLRKRGAWHPLEDDDLFTIIQKGLPGADMPATNVPAEQAWQIAAFVRALTAPAAGSNPPGDASRGEALFRGAAGCGNCHRIRGKGGMLGPDLTNAGMRAYGELQEAIVDPDADGFHRYKAVTVALKDGRLLEGVARNRTNYSVQVQDAQGNLHMVDMQDVRMMKVSAHSPMPRDYSKRLSKQEIEDLLAFLSRQTVRPYEQESK